MRKYIFGLFSISMLHLLGLAPTAAFASSDPIKLTIESLANVSGNGALEACGSAVHVDGVKPLLVTIKHDQSFYTVLTAPNGKWCVVFKRWTFDGQIEASATTLQKPGKMYLRSIDISQIQIR